MARSSIEVRYQAWLISPDGDIKIGPPTPSVALAWQEVHTEGTICFPTAPSMRRIFEGCCRVGRVVPISGEAVTSQDRT